MRSLFWRKFESSGGSPAGREGHTLTYASALDCYLLFGGIGTQRYKEVMSFSTITQTWEPVVASGKIPPERNAHVAWMDEDNQILYIHGGQSGKREALADLYALHLESFAWSRIALVEDQPEERAGHAAAKIQDRAFIFGGSSPANAFMKDLWSFNFSSVDWNSGRVIGQGWTSHPLRGQVPAGRKAHTMVSFEGKLYIFGGITEQGYVNDLYLINTADFKCYKVNAKGNAPSPRAYHAATVMDNGFMVLFGGLESIWDGKTEKLNILGDFYLLNLHEMRWTMQSLQGGQSPSRRYGHVMAWGYGDSGQIVLLGGIDRTFCPMDVYWLEDNRSQVAWNAQESDSRDRRGVTESSTTQKQRIQELERLLQTSNQRA